MTNLLIIDGHGATVKGETFNFQRSSDIACRIYSYTKENINIGVDFSNKIIQAAIDTKSVPDKLTAECTSSRIGGTRVTERRLKAKDQKPGGQPGQPEWDTPVPQNATHSIIDLNKVPLECFFVGQQGCNARTADLVVIYIQTGNTGELKLSDILNYFNQLSYDVIWAPCRGY